MSRRLFSLHFLLFFGCLSIVFQLFFLQVIQGERNQVLSEGNRIKIEKIKAPRGIIYDRDKRPLVYNLPQNTSDGGRLRLRSHDSSEVNGGLTRDYLYGEVLSHLIGYVDTEYVARSGLEKEYDQVLAGQEGGELIEVDTEGKKTREINKKKPVPGENLYLTIDLGLQKRVYQALGSKTGAVVVSNPQNGEILSLVSNPFFDPNIFASRYQPEIVRKILNDPYQSLFNRATDGVYPPGSIFKIVTAAAGLESGKINKNTLIEDTGEIRIGEYRYGNWYFDRTGKTEGFLDVVSAIKRSNDIFFYRVGERVGARELVNWAKVFGLGKEIGFLPDPEKEEWFLGNTYHLSIGQGEIGVTPLQANMMTNVIANGGKLCSPVFIKNTSDGGREVDLLRGENNCQEIGLKKETVEIIKEGMIEACSEGGTSLRFLYSEGIPRSGYFDFPVACKTGTAEFGDPQERTHAWFTVFAPADNPEISITVLIEAGGEGSQVAAPIAKEIMEERTGSGSLQL